MKIKEHYKPIKSLINLILTGEREITINENPIIVVEEFANSLTTYDRDTYNLYFLNRIEKFLESSNDEERFDLLKVYLENDILMTGVTIMNGLGTESKTLGKNDFPDILNSVLLSFIAGREVHQILCFSLYFYIENLSKTKIVNGMIPTTEYKEIIYYNSIKRDIDEVFNY